MNSDPQLCYILCGYLGTNLGVKVLLVPEAAEDLALPRCAPVGDGGEGGKEPGHLLLPVVEGGGGRHH